MAQSRNKIIQQERMIKYFLDATIKIIENEGIEKVTVRKVANLAGYNQATLYNYFENLDHLLFFTSMYYLSEYIDALPVYIKYAKSAKDLYILVWQCFIDFAFVKPEIYYNLFFSSLSNKMETYIEKYYAIFPLDVKKYPSSIRKMLAENNITTRSEVLMEVCVAENFVTQENGIIINNLVIHVFESILMRVYLHSLDSGVAKDMMMDYISLFFEKFEK